MPFSIEDFPIEVNHPKIDVTLPVGTHVFELVVEDSAGLRSAPDRVTVVVQREATVKPEITSITPRFGLREGEKVDAVISGVGLLDATEIKFYRGAQESPRVIASIGSGGTDSELPIVVEIKGNAAFDSYQFAVTTPAGISEKSQVAFRVVGQPVIGSFNFKSANRGETIEELVIDGEHMFIGDELAAEHTVEFWDASGHDSAITAEVRADSTPKKLRVGVEVGNDAWLGLHEIRLTTPAGTTVVSSSQFDVHP